MKRRERVSAPPSKCPERMRLCRLEEDVTFRAGPLFYRALRGEIGGRQRHLLVGDRGIVDANAAALDLAARFAVRCDQTCLYENRQHADSGLKFAFPNPDPPPVSVH